MPLTTASPVSFIMTRNAETARAFYEGTLGLRFEADEPFALVFRVGAEPCTVLRVVKMPEPFTPNTYTVFGWEVDNIEETIDELTGNGLTFLRYESVEQDDRAIWHAPGRAKIAWFQDPDGNTLSLSQHFA